MRELKDFQRVELKAGESREIAFRLTREQLAFVGRDGRMVAEPGRFSLWVGDSAVGGLSAEFELAAS